MTAALASLISSHVIPYGCTTSTSSDGKGGVNLTISKPDGAAIEILLSLPTPRGMFDQIVCVSATVINNLLLSITLD